MYWMYSSYESVGVRRSRHLVVINKWKALPCVPGGESTASQRSRKHTYSILQNLKTLFLPDPVQSGAAPVQYQTWDQCYIVQVDVPAAVRDFPAMKQHYRRVRNPTGHPPPTHQGTRPKPEQPALFASAKTIRRYTRRVSRKTLLRRALLNTLHTWNIHYYLTIRV